MGFLFSHLAGSDDKPVWKTGKSKKTVGKIRPQYKSCKGVDISPLASEEKSGSSKDSTAEFCFTCSVKGIFGLGEVKETARAIQSKAFMEKLKKRVIGQIESKIFQTKMLRACVTQNRNWFSKKKVDWPLMKGLCQKRNKELKTSIKSRWSDMRVNLALSSPAIKEDRVLSNNSTWFDPTPSHYISDFNNMPGLSGKEKTRTKKLYVKALAETSLDQFSSAEFKQRMYRGKPLHLPLAGEKYLTSNDQIKLKRTLGNLQEKAKVTYFEIMSEMPVLGYLKTGSPKKKELAEALEKIEGNLADFLKKARYPESNRGLLLSFKPLVEELLTENKEYCLVAEQARMNAEKDESLNNWLLIGAGVLAAVPCFVTGPVGASACLAGGMALGAMGYKLARDSMDDSLGRALTGKQFETITELNEREKELFLAKLFLPLGAWGTTAVPARAASHAIKHFVSEKSLRRRVQKWGEGTLNRNLNKDERELLVEFYKHNLTSPDIKREILRDITSVNFSKKEIEILSKREIRLGGKSAVKLKIPKKTQEAKELKAQGLNSAYHRGIDEINEWIAVREQLVRLKADPYETHVDYFADKMREHIEYIEQGIKSPSQKRELTHLKKYAKELLEKKKVTYYRWLNFHISLSKILQKNGGFFRNFRETREIIDFEIEGFPHVIAMPTKTGEMGIMAMNKGKAHGVHPLGLKNSGKDSHYFFEHDISHFSGEGRINRDELEELNLFYSKLMQQTKSLPLEKRKNVELAFFVLTHESEYGIEILNFKDVLSNIDEEIAEVVVTGNTEMNGLIDLTHDSYNKIRNLKDDFLEVSSQIQRE